MKSELTSPFPVRASLSLHFGEVVPGCSFHSPCFPPQAGCFAATSTQPQAGGRAGALQLFCEWRLAAPLWLHGLAPGNRFRRPWASPAVLPSPGGGVTKASGPGGWARRGGARLTCPTLDSGREGEETTAGLSVGPAASLAC